jgi:hypothetical protein
MARTIRKGAEASSVGMIGSKTIRAFCAGSSKRASARAGLGVRLEDIEE